MIDTKAMGQRIKQTRKAQGMTVEDLADRVLASVSTVYQWQKGSRTPSVESLTMLSDALGVSLDWLVRGGSNEQEHKNQV